MVEDQRLVEAHVVNDPRREHQQLAVDDLDVCRRPPQRGPGIRHDRPSAVVVVALKEGSRRQIAFPPGDAADAGCARAADHAHRRITQSRAHLRAEAAVGDLHVRVNEDQRLQILAATRSLEDQVVCARQRFDRGERVELRIGLRRKPDSRLGETSERLGTPNRSAERDHGLWLWGTSSGNGRVWLRRSARSGAVSRQEMLWVVTASARSSSRTRAWSSRSCT